MSPTNIRIEPPPTAPPPPTDDYPAEAVAPRFDELGRKFVAEEPMPGILNIPLSPVDALALSIFWADSAANAEEAGNAAVWTFSETRAAHLLRLARQMQPDCQDPILSLSREQLEALVAKRTGAA